jgi:membrane protein
VKAALQRLRASHAYRVWQRYNAARGGVLAGGVAYFAFFSVFPAVTLGFAIFGFVLRGQPHLFHDVVSSVSTTLPGIVQDSAHPDGIIDASKPPTPNVLTITGAVSLVVLVFSGLGWLSGLREGIRAMFDRPVFPGNAVTSRLRDLGVLALLGLSILVSAVLSGFMNAATGRVLGWLGLSSHSTVGRVLLPVAGFLVVLVVDFGIYLVLLRVLSGVPMPWSDLRPAAMLGAVGAGVLKVAVSYGIVGSSTNPVFASFAIVIGLLVVMNLLSRLTLLAAAWAAVGWDQQIETAVAGEAAQVATMANLRPRGLPHPAALEPSFGARSADRTAIAAGAVLGALGAVGVGVLRRASAAVLGALRHRT